MKVSPLSGVLAKRYSRETALRHERLYGRGYQGPGSEEVFLALAAKLDLRPGHRVLDIGSGLGGDAFRLASRFGVDVVGMDASAEMVEVAEERRQEADEDGVCFVVGDVRVSPVAGCGDFDVLWTRDSLSYVPTDDVPPVWDRLLASLRPGGRLLLTDYGRGADAAAAPFADQMAAWGAHLQTFAQYREVAEAAGFTDVVVQDWTQHLVDSQVFGLEQIDEHRDQFLEEMPETALEGLRSRWLEKLQNSRAGHLTWPVVTARRPG